MSESGFGAVVAAGIVGTIAWAISQTMEEEAAVTKVTYTPQNKPTTSKVKTALFGLLGNVIQNVDFGSFGKDRTPTAPSQAATQYAQPLPLKPTPQRASGLSGGIGVLLDLIGSHEAPKGYNQVYGGIRSGDQPPKPLTSMTVGEVLDWQDSIDSRYPSEAAGKYQVMEDTLRGLVRNRKVSRNAIFSPKTQDEIAVTLLERRGLKDYQSGRMTQTAFAQNISKEWASFPAQTVDKRGRRATGQSYYAGDGLNRSSVGKTTVLDVLARIF